MDSGMYKESPGQIIERQGKEIGWLKAENEALRKFALRAFTVVVWVAGEGKLLSFPYYDADDLLLEGAHLLGVEDCDEARAALNTEESENDV